MVEREAKFEYGYTEVRGWWFNVSDVLDIKQADSFKSALFSPAVVTCLSVS